MYSTFKMYWVAQIDLTQTTPHSSHRLRSLLWTTIWLCHQ